MDADTIRDAANACDTTGREAGLRATISEQQREIAQLRRAGNRAAVAEDTRNRERREAGLLRTLRDMSAALADPSATPPDTIWPVIEAHRAHVHALRIGDPALIAHGSAVLAAAVENMAARYPQRDN